MDRDDSGTGGGKTSWLSREDREGSDNDDLSNDSSNDEDLIDLLLDSDWGEDIDVIGDADDKDEDPVESRSLTVSDYSKDSTNDQVVPTSPANSNYSNHITSCSNDVASDVTGVPSPNRNPVDSTSFILQLNRQHLHKQPQLLKLPRMQSSAFLPPRQLPTTMQDQVSSQNQRYVNPAQDEDQLSPQQFQQHLEHQSMQSSDLPPSQLPPVVEHQVPFQNTEHLLRGLTAYTSQNPHIRANQAVFPLPKEVLSSERVGDVVPTSSTDQQQFEQHIQKLSYQQQLRNQQFPYLVPPVLPHLPLHMHGRLSSITASPNPSPQMNPVQLYTPQNPEEVKNLEEMQKFANKSKQRKTNLDSRKDAKLSEDRSDNSTADKFNQVFQEDRDDAAKNYNLINRYLHQENQEQLQRGLICDTSQNPHIRADQAAFPLPKEVLSSERVGDVVPTSSTDQQQFEQHIQQLSNQQQLRNQQFPHLVPPLLPYLPLHMHAPLPNITASPNPSPQMSHVHLYAPKNPEQVKNIDKMQDFANKSKGRKMRRRTQVEFRLWKNSLDSRSGKNTVGLLSHEDNEDSDEEVNHLSGNPAQGEDQLSRKHLQKQPQHQKLQSMEPSTFLPPSHLSPIVQDRLSVNPSQGKDQLSNQHLQKQLGHKKLQSTQPSTFLPPSQLPPIVQDNVSFQNQQSIYSFVGELQPSPQHFQQQLEHQNLQNMEFLPFFPPRPLPAIVPDQITFQNRGHLQRDLMRHIPRTSHTPADHATLPKEAMSSEAITDAVSTSAADRLPYQQQQFQHQPPRQTAPPRLACQYKDSNTGQMTSLEERKQFLDSFRTTRNDLGLSQ